MIASVARSSQTSTTTSLVKKADISAGNDAPSSLVVPWCIADLQGNPAELPPNFKLDYDKASNSAYLVAIRNPPGYNTKAAYNPSNLTTCQWRTLTALILPLGQNFATVTADGLPAEDPNRRLQYFPDCENGDGSAIFDKSVEAHASPDNLFSLRNQVTFNTSSIADNNACHRLRPSIYDPKPIQLSINVNLTGLLTLAYFDNQQAMAPTVSVASSTATQSLNANGTLPMTAVTKWASATQADAVLFDMPGVGTTSRLLSIGSASSDLLAATSLLWVGGAALALVARKVMFPRSSAPAANQNPV